MSDNMPEIADEQVFARMLCCAIRFVAMNSGNMSLVPRVGRWKDIVRNHSMGPICGRFVSHCGAYSKEVDGLESIHDPEQDVACSASRVVLSIMSVSLECSSWVVSIRIPSWSSRGRMGNAGSACKMSRRPLDVSRYCPRKAESVASLLIRKRRRME